MGGRAGAAFTLPEGAQWFKSCEMTMERRNVHACHAGALVHTLEKWTHHEVTAWARTHAAFARCCSVLPVSRSGPTTRWMAGWLAVTRTLGGSACRPAGDSLLPCAACMNDRWQAMEGDSHGVGFCNVTARLAAL